MSDMNLTMSDDSDSEMDLTMSDTSILASDVDKEYVDKQDAAMLASAKAYSDGGIATSVATYISEHKSELKGDPGKDGTSGTNGVDGKTPVRGTDYWTAADIASIESDIQTWATTTILGASS